MAWYNPIDWWAALKGWFSTAEPGELKSEEPPEEVRALMAGAPQAVSLPPFEPVEWLDEKTRLPLPADYERDCDIVALEATGEIIHVQLVDDKLTRLGLSDTKPPFKVTRRRLKLADFNREWSKAKGSGGDGVTVREAEIRA